MKPVVYSSLVPFHRGKIRFKLAAVFRQFIKAANNGEILTHKGDHYTKSTLRGYRDSLSWVEKYIALYGSVYLDEVTPVWAEGFAVFLAENNLAKNTIGTNVGRVRSIMNRAYRAGISPLSGYGIVCTHEFTDKVYVTFEELKRLYHHYFANKGKAKARDVFVMHCFLGLRLSDYRVFLKNPRKYIIQYEGKHYLSITTQKNNIRVVLPLAYMVRKILIRNRFDFGRPYSQQHYSKYIKAIAKEAGINNLVCYTITKGGKRVNMEQQKYDMMSAHTARRTFASLLELMEMPRPSIMKMTGHKTEDSFRKYVRISTFDNAIKSTDHNFFSTRL